MGSETHALASGPVLTRVALCQPLEFPLSHKILELVTTPMLDLASIPIIDHHCHALLRNGGPFTALEFQRFFTESSDATMRAQHVPNTVFYRWAIKELAAFLGCAPNADAVLTARAAIAPADLA